MKLSYLDRQALEKFVDTYDAIINNVSATFANFFVLDVYLNKLVNRLYKVDFKGKEYLVLKRTFRREYRFLFKEPTKEMLEEFISTFEPNYISVHFLIQAKEGEGKLIKAEKEIVSSTNLQDLDSNIRRKHKKSIQENFSLVSEIFDYSKHIADLLSFLDEWRYARGEEKDLWARVENDFNLLSAFGSKHLLQGIVVKDVEKSKVSCLQYICTFRHE